MLQLLNRTPFEATMALFPDAEGIDTVYVVIKATFRIRDPLQVADEQVPPTLEDEYWGEPGASSLKYASEMHLAKPSTDVVLVGRAWGPDGRRALKVDVRLSVAERKKELRVFGDRHWQKGLLAASISPTTPFESMPLVYERAYGGVHDVGNGKVLAEERNPVGVGFRGKRSTKDMDGQPLPNVEDPRRLLKSCGDEADPAGFGFIAPAWLPRRSYAGTYDKAWQEKRAPVLPADFDARFFNAAHPDFAFDRYLEGGEPVEVAGASPNGPLRFDLPTCRFDLTARIAGATEKPVANLETVLIEPDDERLCMTWRASVPCDKKALKVESVEIALAEMTPGGA